MAVYRMLLNVSDKALPKINKENVRANVKYIKRHWIGLDNKQKKKREKVIMIIIITKIIVTIILY